jgi:hypothetical protein
VEDDDDELDVELPPGWQQRDDAELLDLDWDDLQ